MRRRFLILLLSFAFLSSTIIQSKVDITYLGYSHSVYHSNLPSLEFEITNNSQDTLYISENNISITVFKGKSVLKQDKVLPSEGTPFIRPIIRKQFKCEEKQQYEKNLENLKLKFANKLYKKNFGSNAAYKDSKDFIIENIIRDCIILMPNESIDYSTGFYSEKFDKNCRVKAKYLENKRFTYFVDDNGKKIDINK